MYCPNECHVHHYLSSLSLAQMFNGMTVVWLRKVEVLPYLCEHYGLQPLDPSKSWGGYEVRNMRGRRLELDQKERERRQAEIEAGKKALYKAKAKALAEAKAEAKSKGRGRRGSRGGRGGGRGRRKGEGEGEGGREEGEEEG